MTVTPELERWTIYVCPDCGAVEGQRFEYEPADEAWCCEGCDNYPVQAREVEVTPLSALQAERQRRKALEGTASRLLETTLRQRGAIRRLDKLLSAVNREADEAEARAEQAEKERDEARAEADARMDAERISWTRAERLQDALRGFADRLQEADRESGFGDDFEAEVTAVVNDMHRTLDAALHDSKGEDDG